MKASDPGRVLVALDGSQEALRAIPLARTLAAQLHAVVTALHVITQGDPGENPRAALGLDAPELRGLPLEVRTGAAAATILEELERPEVELLVMTTLRAGAAARDVGSVAREVVTKTARPVLLMRPEVGKAPTAKASRLRRLLVPLDGSHETAWALRPAASLARRLGASFDVIYIASPGAQPPKEAAPMSAPKYIDQPHHEWRSWSRELRERLLVECAGVSPGAEVGIHIRRGDPGPEIARFARQGDYDAIVLVRRSKLEPGRATVLRKVIQHAHCPLLVLGGPE